MPCQFFFLLYNQTIPVDTEIFDQTFTMQGRVMGFGRSDTGGVCMGVCEVIE